MALLFVGGVMHPLWIAVLTFYVLAEKLEPDGRWLSLASGLMLAVSGIVLLAPDA